MREQQVVLQHEPVTQLQTTETAMHPMVSMAMEKGNFSPETLSQLLDVQKDWEANEAKKLFNSAFTQMQRSLPVIPRTKKGHNSNYAPLDVSVSLVRPCLDNHGFSFRHSVSQEGGQITVECILAHEAGHSERSVMTGSPDGSGNKNSIQSIGSTRTYLKRYTFEDVIGIATGDGHDDDGQASSSIEYITDHQEADLRALISEKGMQENKVIEWLGKQDASITALRLVPKNKFDSLIERLSK